MIYSKDSIKKRTSNFNQSLLTMIIVKKKKKNIDISNKIKLKKMMIKFDYNTESIKIELKTMVLKEDYSIN